jgi:hypothetical protein
MRLVKLIEVEGRNDKDEENGCILFSIVRTFFIENEAEILHAHYTSKVAFTNLIHKQSIQVKL